MTDKVPTILVVASDEGECSGIVGLLRDVGFGVVAVAAEGAAHAVRRVDFGAAVVALPGQRGAGLLGSLRRRHSGFPVLLVLDPEALALPRRCAAFVKRPLDPQELVGRLLELVLPDTAEASRHDAAECGIAAAKVSCLYRRLVAAAADAVGPLAEDLSRQIGETATLQAGLSTRSAAV